MYEALVVVRFVSGATRLFKFKSKDYILSQTISDYLTKEQPSMIGFTILDEENDVEVVELNGE